MLSTDDETPIASIFYEKDYRLQLLQAISIDRLLDRSEFGTYIVIANGSDNESLSKRFRDDLRRAVSHDLFKSTRVIQWNDLFPNEERTGFYDQQIIKIELARHLRTPWYLLLDAKNHFVNPSSMDDFSPNGTPVSPRTRTNAYWEPYLADSLTSLDLDAEKYSSEHLPSITPYMIHRDSACSLLEYLEEKYRLPWPQAMLKTGRATEFLLYFANLVRLDRLSLYVDRPLPVRTLFTSWPQDPIMAESFIQDTIDNKVPLLGLHRARIPQLSTSQRQLLHTAWRINLLSAWENCDWFLEN